MSRARVAVVPGDGIGPDVIKEGLKVVEAAGVDIESVPYDLGAGRYLRDGTILPDSVLDEWQSMDAIYLGAVGHPDVPPGILERGLLLRIRFDFDLFINHRPVIGGGHDFVVIRENSEGPYAGEGGFVRKGTPHEIATQGSINTRRGVERCIRYAFELAASRKHKHLTMVHKTNVLSYAGDLWQRTFNELASEFPGVETDYSHADAACIHLYRDAGRFSVIVTDNLFGDLLSDLAGAVAGGIGMAASANLNPGHCGPSMFEPVHGSAPDIAGTNSANPMGAILSAALMLDFLGERNAAQTIVNACRQLADRTGTTTGIGDAIAALV